MSLQGLVYAGLKYGNDLKAASRAAQTGSFAPVGRRVGRRIFGKLTGRLARELFG